MWSLLTLYQALRTVMADAAEPLPGTDPDLFSIRLHTARDQVIQANGIVSADTDRDTLLGMIGRRILTGLLPTRRHRVSTRKVKSPMSRYSERHADGRPGTSHNVTRFERHRYRTRGSARAAHGLPGRPTRQPFRTAPTLHPGHAPGRLHTSVATP